MARYKADRCYTYTGEQIQMVNPAKKSTYDKRQVLDFVNTTRKTWFDGKLDEFESEVGSFVSALAQSQYTPT